MPRLGLSHWKAFTKWLTTKAFSHPNLTAASHSLSFLSLTAFAAIHHFGIDRTFADFPPTDG